jgi:hypothetical protein
VNQLRAEHPALARLECDPCCYFGSRLGEATACVTTLASPKLGELIGRPIELAYSDIDADGSLREARVSAVDFALG